MSRSPEIDAEYINAAENQSLGNAYIQDKLEAIGNIIENNPRLKATFELVAEGKLVVGYFFTVDGLKTVKPLDAGARKIADIIGAGENYDRDDETLLESAFDIAGRNGRTVKVERTGNLIFASFGPKPL